MSGLDLLLQKLASQSAVLVVVDRVQGSVPREVGAWMAVFRDDVLGTVGGGQLEHQAIARARRRLGEPSVSLSEDVQRCALGPSLGQCCGGVVFMRYENVSASDVARLDRQLRKPGMPVALFGGGHVGHALVHVLGVLPCDVTWVDSRDGIFPAAVPANVRCEISEPVHDAVASLAPGSRVLVMSFSHAEDLDIVAACLRRQRDAGDLPWIGLIGSRTKWASFRRRLSERGFAEAELDAVTCPIGVPGVPGKEPAVIAVAAAAQLLQTRVADAGA